MMFDNSPYKYLYVPKHGQRHAPAHASAAPTHASEGGRPVQVHARAPTPSWDGDSSENVDREAEEFIRMQHRKFELSKGMSMKKNG
ncbi:hypothetical protein SAY87_028851 [Trapa incisa]|uniref:Uncharacterized protein n=1 Tax=Trapa incisa TaxID=236973 RepID=A0AAN7KUS9_9MYRT|nr:hypothetical protein SAY87_028851 [Trapa incisa]